MRNHGSSHAGHTGSSFVKGIEIPGIHSRIRTEMEKDVGVMQKEDSETEDMSRRCITYVSDTPVI